MSDLIVNHPVNVTDLYVSSDFIHGTSGCIPCEICALQLYREEPSFRVCTSTGIIYDDVPFEYISTVPKDHYYRSFTRYADIRNPKGRSEVYRPDLSIYSCNVRVDDRLIKGDLILTMDWVEDDFNANLIALKTGDLVLFSNKYLLIGNSTIFPKVKQRRYD
jgi:hypothetical protein